MKLKLPEPSLYPLADLAIAWGCTVEQIEIFGNDGLEIIPYPLDAFRTIRVVRAEEKARWEALGSPAKRRFRSDERDSLLLLVGAFAVGYSGGDPAMLTEPGRLVSDLQECAATNGAPMPRSYDTNTALLVEAIELLEVNGYKRPKKPANAKAPETDSRAELRSAPQSSDPREAQAA